jgi:hypothetical protein
MPGSNRYTFAALGVVAALSLLFFTASPAHAQRGGNGKTPPAMAKKIGKPISPDLIATLKKASQAGLRIGSGPTSARLKLIDGTRLDSKNKVGFFYMGADFCPFCAGQRWAVLLTLVRFGDFEGLRYMASSPTDVYSNTPTLSFQHMKYKSKHVDFQAVETADRNGGKLMTPSKLQEKIVNTYDKPPYTRTFGGIPFIYLDGRYLLTHPMVTPPRLSGLDWKTIAKKFADPESELFQKVMPKVNLLSAAICRLDGGSPDEVCASSGVIAANGVLLKLKPAKD